MVLAELGMPGVKSIRLEALKVFARGGMRSCLGMDVTFSKFLRESGTRGYLASLHSPKP
jgi:hypothetical protein